MREHQPVPEELTITNIEDIAVSNFEQTLKVGFKLRVGNYPLHGQETLSLANDTELNGLLMQVEEVIRHRLTHPVSTNKEVKCNSCNANCCTAFSHIALYEHDLLPLMQATGAKDLEELKAWNIVNGEPRFGQVGWLGRVYLQDETAQETLKASHSCVFLTWDTKGVGRCGIYEHRPQVCRDFKERSCSMKGDAEPLLYKIRKSGKYAGKAKVWKGDVFDPEKEFQKAPHMMANDVNGG